MSVTGRLTLCQAWHITKLEFVLKSSSDWYWAVSNEVHFLLVAYPVHLTKRCILHGPAGAIIAANADMNGLTGIMACWVGLFAPGILLIYGLLPWWARFRQLGIYRRYVACLSFFATSLQDQDTQWLCT